MWQETAREAVACRILGRSGRQIDERFIERIPQSVRRRSAGELEEKLAGAVETARYDDVKYMIGLAFHEARKRRAFASEYYQLAGLLFTVLSGA